MSDDADREDLNSLVSAAAAITVPEDERAAALKYLRAAILDRLTHHVHIPEMNGESFRLAQAKIDKRRANCAANAHAKENPDQ